MPRAPPAGSRRDRPGYSPMPAIPWSRAPDGIRHARHADHRLDVVHPDDVRATGDAERDRGRGPFQPLAGRQVEGLADERLPRRADQERKPQPAQLGQSADDLQVFLAWFPESDAGVEDDAIVSDAGRSAHLDALEKALRDLANQVAVTTAGFVVHQDDRGAGLSDGPRHRGI